MPRGDVDRGHLHVAGRRPADDRRALDRPVREVHQPLAQGMTHSDLQRHRGTSRFAKPMLAGRADRLNSAKKRVFPQYVAFGGRGLDTTRSVPSVLP